jgi:hypothetical protein
LTNHFDETDLAANSPLLGEEGWLRIKKYREASFESADGVVILD